MRAYSIFSPNVIATTPAAPASAPAPIVVQMRPAMFMLPCFAARSTDTQRHATAQPRRGSGWDHRCRADPRRSWDGTARRSRRRGAGSGGPRRAVRPASGDIRPNRGAPIPSCPAMTERDGESEPTRVGTSRLARSVPRMPRGQPRPGKPLGCRPRTNPRSVVGRDHSCSGSTHRRLAPRTIATGLNAGVRNDRHRYVWLDLDPRSAGLSPRRWPPEPARLRPVP